MELNPRLAQARILVVAAITGIIALAAGAIFDRTEWPLVLAGVVPALVVAFAFRRPWWQRAPLTILATVGSVGAVTIVAGGSLRDAGRPLGAGWGRLLSTEWPSPVLPGLLATVGAMLAVTSALGAELARSPRLHLTPLAPGLACWAAVTALSAPAGAAVGWLLPLGALALLFAVLRPGAPLAERLSAAHAERQLLPVLFGAALAAVTISIPLTLEVRADPRREETPERTLTVVDPVEATLALRALEPPIDLYDATVEPSEAPMRWRTAALDVYDGQRWTPDLTLRPIGQRLGASGEDDLEVRLVVRDDTLQLLPIPGEPVIVDAPIETDDERTVIRLVERAEEGETITIVADPFPVEADVDPGSLATRPLDENVSGLADLAASLAGEGTILEQLEQLADTMRSEYGLDPDAPGGGLQRALIDRFLRDTQRGNREQFVTAYVLLARALGADSRVATGFAPSTGADGSVAIRSDAATTWPEVRLLDGRWLPFDPVPDDIVFGEGSSSPPPRVQTPAAAQPPESPTPQSTDDDRQEPAPDETEEGGNLPVTLTVILQALAVAGTMLLPFLLVATAIVGVKSLRRRRRLRAGSVPDRVRGAWAVGTDSLVDAGLTIRPAATNTEIAEAGRPLAEGADRELARLSTLSGAATFGTLQRPELIVDDALGCLAEIETSIAEGRSWWGRLRWRLSLRSLRRRTRSPV